MNASVLIGGPTGQAFPISPKILNVPERNEIHLQSQEEEKRHLLG